MSQPKDQSPSLRTFALAFWANWFTAMSGPLSVPAALAALYVESQTAKILLGLTALACMWAAAYYVWKPERERVVELEKQTELDPKLAARTALWELRKEGIKLVGGGRKTVLDQQAADDWRIRYEAWRQQVFDTAEDYSPDFRQSLDPPNQIAQDNRPYVKFQQSKHPARVHTAAEICARIYKVLSPTA